MGIDQPDLEPSACYTDSGGQRYYLFEETHDSVFRDVIDELAADVAASYTPDAIVWINKGGASVGPRFAHYFDEVPTGSITADSYTDHAQQEQIDIYDHALDRVTGDILLVDDIADSGRTLAAAEQELSGLDAVNRVRTATIHVSEACKHQPDHHYEAVPDDVWVVYEWEEIPADISAGYRIG